MRRPFVRQRTSRTRCSGRVPASASNRLIAYYPTIRNHSGAGFSLDNAEASAYFGPLTSNLPKFDVLGKQENIYGAEALNLRCQSRLVAL
jgi:hypothetical protein